MRRKGKKNNKEIILYLYFKSAIVFLHCLLDYPLVRNCQKRTKINANNVFKIVKTKHIKLESYCCRVISTEDFIWSLEHLWPHKEIFFSLLEAKSPHLRWTHWESFHGKPWGRGNRRHFKSVVYQIDFCLVYSETTISENKAGVVSCCFRRGGELYFLKCHQMVNCFIKSGGKPLQCAHYFEKVRWIIFDKIDF